jgi:YidC/Oxa1 family membrane protein insertase
LALQMPVFISLFYMLRKDLRHDICPDINPPTVPNPKPCGSTEASQFFFIPDITDKATGGVLVALVVLYVGSQLLSSIFMTTTTDRNQRLIMMALPFVFVAFVINFPAGLLVYWITTNLWTVGQGLVVRRLAPNPALAGAATGTAGLPSPARAAAAAPERRRRPQDRDENGGSAEQKPAARAAAPPPPPRKKKKRSGRRR